MAGGFLSIEAHAGTITVWGCHRPDGQAAPLDRWTSTITATYINNWSTCAGSGAGAFGTWIYAQPHPGHSYGDWMFSAPSGTSVVGFRYTRSGSVYGWASIEVFQGQLPIYDSAHLQELCQASAGCAGLSPGTVTSGLLPDADGMLMLTESCALDSGCDAGSYGTLSVSTAAVTLDDSDAPTFSSVSGSLVSGASLSGTASLSVQAADVGTGLYRLRTSIDGTVLENRLVDDNGGRCATVGNGRDFVYAVPCRLTASTGTTLDTTKLREGQHALTVVLEDAAGNVTTAVNKTITVDNVALPSGGVPGIAGSATVGTTLIAKPGTWDGASGSFGFQWQRCDASGGGCENVATGATYALTLADVGSRLRVRVTATNSTGEQASALSALTDVVQEQSGGATGASESPGQVPAAAPGPAAASPQASPNGRNASVNVRLDASFGAGRRLLVTTAGKRGLRIVGRLLNADDGLPIAGASVEQTVTTADGYMKSGRALTTNAGGTFAIALPRNPVSGTWTLRYRSRAGAAVVASVTLRLRVRARIVWHASGARRVLTFTGRISRPVPARPVQYVEVQWRRGGGWATLAHPVAVARSGHFSLRYAVGSNVAAGQRFQFRVAIRETSARYPYDTATTPARWVTVR